MKKLLLLTAIAAALITIGAFSVRAWRAHVVAKLEGRAYTQAHKLLAEGRPLDALAVADMAVRTDARHAWSAVEFNALVAARHIPRLMAAYTQSPERVLANEEASLLVARALFAARQREDFAKVREAWRGREQQPQLWLALDSDALGLEGKVQEAEELLRGTNFVGEAEATRLVRLALHSANRNLYESWTLLDRAFALAPRNPEVRSFRAQVLESIGKPAEARVEYVAAHVADPKNPLWRDELAEFYRRQGSYDLALQTWRDALNQPAADFIALKEAFWSRVIQPKTTPPSTQRVQGELLPLVDFVRVLPPERFWDAEPFGQLALSARYTKERPEVFWLGLLEMLRTGRETDAAEHLRVNRFRTRSWRPELEAALVQILHFRTNQSFAGLDLLAAPVPSNSHPFLVELHQCAKTDLKSPGQSAVTPELAKFLMSREVFAAAFLAAGWREAALQLTAPTASAELPAWFSFGMAQCLRFNRGNEAALDYLAKAPQSPELTLLRGEILLAQKQTQEGLRQLSAIAKDNSDAGYRAAWLVAQSAIETRDFAQAQTTVAAQPRLAESTAGRELLARIALLRSGADEAEPMYRAIETESVEARAFLARRAFERRDWPAAREQTEALMRRLPDELQLRENLMAIERAQKTNENR
jgi:hypothetical protein